MGWEELFAFFSPFKACAACKQGFLLLEPHDVSRDSVICSGPREARSGPERW